VKSATTCGTSLAAGASCTVSVEFKPAASGALTATLAVADSVGTQSVTLTGTGASTALTVIASPASLTFASTAVGATTAAQVVTLKNASKSTVTISGIAFTGADASSFVRSANNCPAAFTAGEACAISVEFAPKAAGALTASLTITDNAGNSPQTVALSGTGTGVPIAITLSPTGIAFPATAVGAVSAVQVVTVKSTGTSTATLSSISITGSGASSFYRTATTCPKSLASGGTCTVSLVFKPAGAGALTAQLAIGDNAPNSPQTVSLTGTGTSGGGGGLTLSATSIAFPATIVNATSDAQVVTLTNSGSASVTISSIALSGTNAASFLDLNNCGATLGAGASCGLFVAFHPTAAGADTATLSVTDTATGSPQKVTLSGTGSAAPSVKLSATSIAFPTTAHGSTSEAQAVTLTNTGTATLTLTSITLTGTNPADFEALNGCGATLAANASCAVYLAFKPAAAGSFSGTLTVADNGAASPQTVKLTGTGD